MPQVAHREQLNPARRDRNRCVHEAALLLVHSFSEIDGLDPSGWSMLSHLQQQKWPRGVKGQFRTERWKPVMPDTAGAHSEMSRDEPITGVEERQQSGEMLVLGFVNLLHDASNPRVSKYVFF